MAPGTCHAAPPLGEVRTPFNIGVYEIFAKHGSLAARGPAENGEGPPNAE